MKHLRIFENINTEKLVKDTMDEYERICDLICEFINLEKLYPCFPIKYVMRYYFDEFEDNQIALFAQVQNVDTKYDEDCLISMIEGQNLENLYIYINDPEQYKSSKKYNI